MATDERGDWMQTYTGKKFYPTDPRPEDVDIYDIAHALSMICRYGGHTTKFYSVAEHCLLMSYEVPDEDSLWALLHDASEAYMGDMVRPLKYQMPQYREAEDRVVEAVMDRFNLPHEMPASVHDADARIILDEKAAVMRMTNHKWNTDGLTPLGVHVYGLRSEQARQMYLNRFVELLAAQKERDELVI